MSYKINELNWYLHYRYWFVSRLNGSCVMHTTRCQKENSQIENLQADNSLIYDAGSWLAPKEIIPFKTS